MYQEKLPRLQSRTPRPLLRRHVIVLSIHYAINATLYTLKVRASERESNSLELLQRAQPKLNNEVVNPQPAACCPVFVLVLQHGHHDKRNPLILVLIELMVSLVHPSLDRILFQKVCLY